MANPSNFRTISFPAMLRETLTTFFSLNKAGQATWGYKYCAACLVTLVEPFAAFEKFRFKENLIANCKFQVGQLVNVLNFLYDSALKRIVIVQSIATPQFFWQFAYNPSMFLGTFDEYPIKFLRTFGSGAETTSVTIQVPADADLDDLTATVAKIAMDGVPYKIEVV